MVPLFFIPGCFCCGCNAWKDTFPLGAGVDGSYVLEVPQGTELGLSLSNPNVYISAASRIVCEGPDDGDPYQAFADDVVISQAVTRPDLEGLEIIVECDIFERELFLAEPGYPGTRTSTLGVHIGTDVTTAQVLVPPEEFFFPNLLSPGGILLVARARTGQDHVLSYWDHLEGEVCSLVLSDEFDTSARLKLVVRDAENPPEGVDPGSGLYFDVEAYTKAIADVDYTLIASLANAPFRLPDDPIKCGLWCTDSASWDNLCVTTNA